MKKKVFYLITMMMLTLLVGCAEHKNRKTANINPGSVIVDSSSWSEKEAKNLANAQCAKSKRQAKRIDSPDKKTNDDYRFECVN